MFVFNQFEAKPTDLGAFIRAWHRLYVFPRLAPDLVPDDVFPRLAPISCYFILLLCQMQLVLLLVLSLQLKQNLSYYLTANITMAFRYGQNLQNAFIQY